MKALVLWSAPNSTNLGVRALHAGSQAILERSFGTIETVALSHGASTAPMPVGNWKKTGRELLTRRAGLVEWLADFDLVVDTRGGDSFADIYGLGRHLTMSALAEAVHRSRTPLVLGPQTAGPFNQRSSKLLAKRSLQTARIAMARDTTSFKVMQQLGAKPQLVTDVVFALPAPTGVQTGKYDILLNVSGLLWSSNPHVDHERYRSTIHSLCKELLRRGRKVTLLAHVIEGTTHDDDVPAVASAQDLPDLEVETFVPDSLEDVRRAIASSNLVIASRMHACLNALSLGVPTVPLAYSRKFGPLFQDLDYIKSINLKGDLDIVEQALAATEDPQLVSAASNSRTRAAHLTDSAIKIMQDAL